MILTDADFSVLRPAASVHFRVKVVACVTAVLESVPESAFAPLHTFGEEVAIQDAAPWLVVWYLAWPVSLAGAEEDRTAQWLTVALSAYLLPQAIPL